MKIVRQDYKVKSPRCQRPLRLVCLTDLHIRRDTNWQNLEDLLEKIAGLPSVDAIIFTGDLLDSADEHMKPGVEQRALDFLERLAKCAPVFMVYGNHDVCICGKTNKKNRPIIIPHDFRAKVAKIPGLTVLENEVAITHDLVVAGLEMHSSYYSKRDARSLLAVEDEPALAQNLAKFLRHKCTKLPDLPRIFLFHSPFCGALLKEKLQDFDLILTGHMHNGCLPRPLLKLPGNRGIVGPNKHVLANYSRGRDGKLIILSPVATLPSTLHVLDSCFPTYFTVITMEPEN